MFSRSPAHIEQAAAELRAGNVYINRDITGAVVGRQPFGGYGMSGVGSKAGGPDYLLQFVDPRVVTENTLRQGFARDKNRAPHSPPPRLPESSRFGVAGDRRRSGLGRRRRVRPRRGGDQPAPSTWRSPAATVAARSSRAASSIGVHLVDVVFDDCELSGALLLDGRLTRVQFNRCRMSGSWRRVGRRRRRFLDCKLDGANFRMSSWERRLAALRAPDADLGACVVAHVRLFGCNLSGADVAKVRLDDVALHGSNLDGLRGADALRGAVIGSDQVVPLAVAAAGGPRDQRRRRASCLSTMVTCLLGFALRELGYTAGVDPHLLRLLKVIESVVYGLVLVLASRLPDTDAPADDLLATPL